MCDMYIYATVMEVLSSGETVTLEYELDKVLYTRRLEMNTLDNNILLQQEQVSIAKEYMETKMRRMNKVQPQESIIYFHTTSGTYVKRTVISIQNHDVEFKGYEKSPTKAFYVEVPSEGSLQHKFLMYPFEYKVFKSQHEFESMYKATYQPKLYSSKTIVNLRKTVKMVSSFFMSQLRSFSDVITIAQLDVGVSLMAHKEWKETEKYFKPYNDKNSNSLNDVERIDLKSPVIIIPIIYETMKCIIIRHRYLPATEKESSTNNQVKNNNYHHDFYCIYSHQQSNTHIKEFEEHYQNTELCKENDCTFISWKDIHIEEETQCLSTCLYALMTNFLGIVGSVKKCLIDEQVMNLCDVQDVVCGDIVSVFANNEFMNERTILSSDKWIQENDLQGKMIQNRISEKSFISTYGTNQGLNGIWNFDELNDENQGNFVI